MNLPMDERIPDDVINAFPKPPLQDADDKQIIRERVMEVLLASRIAALYWVSLYDETLGEPMLPLEPRNRSV
jgi:hypothetical protein